MKLIKRNDSNDHSPIHSRLGLPTLLMHLLGVGCSVPGMKDVWCVGHSTGHLKTLPKKKKLALQEHVSGSLTTRTVKDRRIGK